ncbi:hypothetical protein BH11MYX3_BH11MYX3_01770 [soil metagenome]
MMKWLSVTVVAATTLAHAAPVDLTAELHTFAAKVSTKDTMRVSPVAPAGCTAPTQAERTDLTKRMLAWIDAKHPDERGPKVTSTDSLDLVVTFGCTDSTGAIVLDISQDREPARPREGAYGTRRNYLLRVTSAIEILAEDTSTLSMNWMEWADEGRISLLAQVDLDGDRALDIVYSDHEREGGASSTFDRIHVRFASGRLGESAQITNLTDVKLVGNQLVLAGRDRDDVVFYGCLDRNLHVGPCPASRPLQKAADARAIAARYLTGEVPDRDLLGQELTTLGIPAKRKAYVLAAATETPAGDRAQRRVTAFLVKTGLVEPAPMPDIISQPNTDARSYLDDLAAKLGDAPCTMTPLTDAEKTTATAWVRKQDAKASEITIAASACGPYLWVAWSPNRDNKRRQVLLGRDGTTRVLGFTFEVMELQSELGHSEQWFMHGGTLVGVAIASGNLWVIVDNKIAAQTKGDRLAFYRADDRWSEASSDVFVDGGALWHATPTGREKLELTLVRDHEARRAAIALVQGSPATSDARYLAALQLLGADKALIAECKRL